MVISKMDSVDTNGHHCPKASHPDTYDNSPCYTNGSSKQAALRQTSSNGSAVYVPLINKMNQHIESGTKFFSFEYLPPRTPNSAPNLLARIERMTAGGPLFIDITWHLAGDPMGDKETSSMMVANAAVNYVGVETMLHITCQKYSKKEIRQALHRAKDMGLRNILALRGDIPVNQVSSETPKDGLSNAEEMVKLVREDFDDHFCICVAGYTQGHPDATSYERDLVYLKRKVDAGANFIITQLFFEAQHYIKFVKDCRAIGITVPIIPGIFPIQSYNSLQNVTKLSKLTIPKEIIAAITPIKDNDQAIRHLGIDLATAMCKELLDAGAPSLHFYTMNLEVATIEVLKRLGMWVQEPKKCLPWKTSANYKRQAEDVRPIFWQNRPNSYIQRTIEWDEFPNGRWGHSASPAFGQLDYNLFYLQSRIPKEQLLNMWGRELNSVQNVFDVFCDYISGREREDGSKVVSLPWSDGELASETLPLLDQLLRLNQNGILTINSQPSVNGAPSTDKVHGWGNPGGYVYQKAYVEFFISDKRLSALLSELKNYSQVTFHIINQAGEEFSDGGQDANAVTWGVFPGREIIQPTVVDPESFRYWKDEAFGLWQEQWGSLYPTDSPSRKIIDSVRTNFYLANLVDNEFPKETCLWQLLNGVLEA